MKWTSEELGGAEVGFGVASHISTSIQTGHGIAAAPDELMSTASLGLRLKLQDGVERITMVTHAFIETADTDSALRRRISNWVVMAKDALRSVRPRREPTIATFESRSHGIHLSENRCGL